MSFQGFICWKDSLLQRVFNTEALQTDNSIFLATHHPIRMYRQSLKRASARQEYDQRRFLKDFLARESFAFVPVLGSAGTGKSHLIRWLALNIPDADNRRIVLIPRGGTNLRDVIHRILEGIEGLTFDEYRDRLDRATSGLTDAKARESLLNNLAVAVGANGGGVRPGEVQGIDQERREAYRFLEGALPPLLYDALFRAHLLRDDGIIANLVRHTLGATGVERREARRQFSTIDLPSDVRDLPRAGADARQIYTELLGDRELKDLAIEWMNLHLDEAIGQLLQLAGEDLTRLMRDVRGELAVRGIELVLLIEDFAKLQGIERPLLDAVLEQPNQPDRAALCVLRTALACTTDYFRGVEDTVRERTTFVVNLDREALSGDGMITARDFEQFASRYLNAVRLRDGELDNWYGQYRDGDEDAPVPNACEECSHRETCHAAFGASGGYGLYPFNPTALLEMYGRVHAEEFSPRLLISDVLKHTLEDYGAYVARGAFPPPALLASFGGSRLSAVTRREIASRDPIHTSRREVLVEFWAGGEVIDLDPGLHEAFRLPPLGIAPPPVPTPGPGGALPPAPGDPEVPLLLQRDLETLDRWQNGEELPQSLTTTLREAVFEAVYNRINWDAGDAGPKLLRGVGKGVQEHECVLPEPGHSGGRRACPPDDSRGWRVPERRLARFAGIAAVPTIRPLGVRLGT